MRKLSFQDAFFLRAETPTCPFHVASVAILTLPESSPRNYLRKLSEKFGRIREVWPVFGLQLNDPGSLRNPCWVESPHFDPKDHVFHYSLPKYGTMADLLNLVASAHEVLLDRTRPMWQIHIIEGLPQRRFAIYCKVHHALMDGVGALRMVQEMYSEDATRDLLHKPDWAVKSHHVHDEESIGHVLKQAWQVLLKQAKAVPEASSLLGNFGLDWLRGKKDVPQLPFSAPHSILNGELGSRRRFITCEFPLDAIRKIGKAHDATVNDVFVAICGSALRRYLLGLGKLPERSLDAGMPVSIKSDDGTEGNQLSFIICPFATDEADPVARLQHVVNVTRKAKQDLSAMMPEANADLTIMTMVPFLMVSMMHITQKVPPVFNAIVSNVPGPRRQMYLDGARLEALYPFSVVTDGMGLNITLISYQSTLCVGITAAPENEPKIQVLGSLMLQGFEELLGKTD